MTPEARQTRVLVCDESPAYGESLARFLGAGTGLDVVGVCATGREAIRALPRLSPDLVTIDLDSGGAARVRLIEEIMRSHPVPILVLSQDARRGSAEAADAIAAGAVDAVPKTHVRLDDPEGAAAVALRHRLRRLARTRTATGPGAPPAMPAVDSPATRSGNSTVVAICASTGGPRALETVLAGLPADFPLPVLVVQHMSLGFMGGLIAVLERSVPLPIGVARDGQGAAPGIWFPPDDAHLLLGAGMRLSLDRETVVSAHRPSADVLLASVADSAGPGAVGVVLTGMGRDGAAGVAAIRRRGGRVIAQDEATSVVYGMPRAAAGAGASSILALPDIAPALRRLVPTESRA
jgi:two-component system, chemotaxis family, protein-glutamate methylesterase/glutaminase